MSTAAEAPTGRLAEAAQPERPDVFISYSRKNKEFVERLFATLEAQGKDVWIDRDDIRAGAEWWEKIRQGIEASRVVIVVLSPAYLESEICRDELEHALSLQKRLIPIVREDVEPSETHERIAALNWIFFRETDDFDTALSTLAESVETDQEWLDRHARYAVRAGEWARAARNKSYLIGGDELREAEQWLAEQGSHREAASALQQEFILASRGRETRRQRTILASVLVALAVALVLAAVAIVLRGQAIDREKTARSRALAASAETQLPVDPELSLILASRALDYARTSQAEEMLRLALAESDVRRSFHLPIPPPLTAKFDPSGRYVLTLSRDGTVAAVDTRTLAVRKLSGRRGNADLLGGLEEDSGAAFSPDGTLAFVANRDGSLTAWHVGRWSRAASWRGRYIAAESPRRPRFLVTVDANLQAEVRRFPSGQRLTRLGLGDVVTTLVSANGNRIATVDARDGPWSVTLWFGPDWRRSRRLPNQFQAAFSPDGKYIVTTSNDGDRATVWSARTGRRLAETPPSCRCELLAGFSKDGRFFLTSSNDTTDKQVWRSATAKPAAELQGNLETQLDAFSFDGSAARVATASDYGTASVWELPSGKRLAFLRGHRGRIRAISIARDGSIVTVGSDAVVRFWKIRPRTVTSHLPDGVAVAGFTPDGVVAVTRRGELESAHSALWRARVRPRVRLSRWVRVTDTDTAYFPELQPRGTYAAFDLGSVVDGRTGDTIRPNEGFSNVAFSPDGGFLAAARDDGDVAVWRVGSWRQIHRLHGLSADSQLEPDIALSPGGELLFASPFESNAGIWRTSDGRRISELETYPAIYDAAFSADGDRLLVAPEDMTPRVIDVRSGAHVAELHGHEGAPETVEFSPDGGLVLTAGSGSDSTVRLWSPDDGRKLWSLRLRRGSLAGATFDPSGSSILTWGGDGTVRIFDCDICGSYDDLLNRARERITRSLDPAEQAAYGLD